MLQNALMQQMIAPRCSAIREISVQTWLLLSNGRPCNEMSDETLTASRSHDLFNGSSNRQRKRLPSRRGVGWRSGTRGSPYIPRYLWRVRWRTDGTPYVRQVEENAPGRRHEGFCCREPRQSAGRMGGPIE